MALREIDQAMAEAFVGLFNRIAHDPMLWEIGIGLIAAVAIFFILMGQMKGSRPQV